MGKLPAKSDFSEWFTQVIGPEGAGLVDIRYGVQGFIVHTPYGMHIIRRIYDLLEREVEAQGHEPVLFPTVIKKEYLEKEAEHAGFTPEVFWVDRAGSEKLEEPLALRPTGETQFYPMFSLWIRSHNQLPFKTYQSRHTVFRNEMTTRPFLRGREFLFFETHNVYSTHEQCMEQIRDDMKVMQTVIHDELCLPFHFFRRPKWDAFLGADATYVSDTLMPDGKRNQMSSTHDLGTNFAKAFNITYADAHGKQVLAHQSCFGPGVWRIMAALVGIHGDDQGLVLPTIVAPTQIAIVPIFRTDDEKAIVHSAIEELLTHLKPAHRVAVDWSAETPGFKFNQWEMKGAPLRIEVGPKDVAHGTFVLKRRLGAKIVVPAKEIVAAVREELKAHDHEIRERAKQYFGDNTREATTLPEIVSVMDRFRGFALTNWCTTTGMDGKPCAEILKKETQGAYVCGERVDEKQTPPAGSVCAVCGKPATARVYIAKSY